jgi:hypothetical protein
MVFEKGYITRCSSTEWTAKNWCWRDDATVVSAGKLRKLWDFLSELRSSLCEGRLDRIVVRPALLPAKTAQFTQFFHQVWRHTVKLPSLTEVSRALKPVSRVILLNYWYPPPAVRPPYTATYRTFSNTKPFDLSSTDDSPILKLHSTDVGRLFMEGTQNANQIRVQRRLARMLLFILQNPGCRYLSLTATLKKKRVGHDTCATWWRKTNIKNRDLDVEKELDEHDKSERRSL